jgi:hypothetical protein
MKKLILAAVALCALALSSCGGGGSTPVNYTPTLPAGVNDILQIIRADGTTLLSEPGATGSTSLTAGTSVNVHYYYVYRESGAVKWREVNEDLTFDWAGNGTVASLNANGRLSGLAAGTDTVTVSYQGNDVDLDVTVL